ncbi:unnamed protein product [Nezara viridula]|uniref:Neuropeptide n=1 Tax=Nezara viridula TaxID=85310 RepID=A0A9P0HI69_NEZVI|nr:unnamed protein product [Nezara viridula]
MPPINASKQGRRHLQAESSELAELIFDYCDNMNMPPELYESYRTTLVLLQYFLPLIVISYAYARVALTLWGSTAPGNAQSDRDSNIMRNKKKVLKVS